MWIHFNMNNICSFFFFFIKYYMKFGKNISLFMSFNCEGFSLMQSKGGSHGLPQLMTPDFYIFILELFFSLSLVFSLCFWWLCPHNYFLSYFFFWDWAFVLKQALGFSVWRGLGINAPTLISSWMTLWTYSWTTVSEKPSQMCLPISHWLAELSTLVRTSCLWHKYLLGIWFLALTLIRIASLPHRVADNT